MVEGEENPMNTSPVQIEDCTLYLGNCLEILPQLSSVDLVLSDPPYGTTPCRWDTPIPLKQLWLVLQAVRRPTTPVILTAQTPFDKVLGCSNLPELRYEWIWEKTTATGHLNAKKMPMKAHENILVFYKRLPTYNPWKTEGHKRKTALKVDRARKQSLCYGKQSGVTDYDSTERYPRSVLTFAQDKYRLNLHPTQKPVALMEYMIRTYTNPGETVLDFAMGSGTTGVACLHLNRRFIGIEIDPETFEIARTRIAKEARIR